MKDDGKCWRRVSRGKGAAAPWIREVVVILKRIISAGCCSLIFVSQLDLFGF